MAAEVINVDTELENNSDLPDGVYVGKLVNIEAKNSKNSEEPQITATFEVLSGDYQGRNLPMWYNWKKFELDPKTKKKRARGLLAYKQTLAAVKKPLVGNDANVLFGDLESCKKAAKVFKERVQGAHVLITLSSYSRVDKNTGQTKTGQNRNVTGLSDGTAPKQATPLDAAPTAMDMGAGDFVSTPEDDDDLDIT